MSSGYVLDSSLSGFGSEIMFQIKTEPYLVILGRSADGTFVAQVGYNFLVARCSRVPPVYILKH